MMEYQSHNWLPTALAQWEFEETWVYDYCIRLIKHNDNQAQIKAEQYAITVLYILPMNKNQVVNENLEKVHYI